MLRVEELAPTRKNLRKFIRLPFEIYKDDPNWVPPLILDQMNTLQGKHNMLFENGIHKFFVAYDGDRMVARALAGIDYKLIERMGIQEGYISLFESYDNQEYANAVLDAAATYLRGEGMEVVIGPNPATFDDFNKGMLVHGFDGPPVLFNAYNQPYNVRLFENYGFVKHCDHFAYELTKDLFLVDRYAELVEMAEQRYGFTTRRVDLKTDLKQQIQDIAQCVAEAFPSEWNLMPPTYEDIYHEFFQLKAFINTDFVWMAYAGERPVGLLVALPDYNELIKKTGGRLNPWGLWVLLTQRRKIGMLRAVMQFVVPEYQNKAVNGVLFYRLYCEAMRYGIHRLEASTIDENNTQSNLSMEKAGARLYRTYRQYKYSLS